MTWITYCLRNVKGEYTIVLGKVKINDDEDIYKKFGPCGPNPFYYFQVFDKNGNQVKLDYNIDYASMSKENWNKYERNMPKKYYDGFEGTGFKINVTEVPKISLDVLTKLKDSGDLFDKSQGYYFREDQY